ncbi:nickel pincer cofactor biosynthesis protein LarB [Calycomorphotria hydatis]|uniref:AIR carboxylase n=1 Tax=Calycomorphotria hydatis TaxID=2528027 RepID=A0A517T575_9PLAN|nr:nickel pincer cofactor biosynthesis protein LarB [Calycomorphotria hydatis]QDT63527.1 AIR carboxylase [Calycomorphotria hydatis]
MTPSEIEGFLARLQAGEISAADAAQQLISTTSLTARTADSSIDLARESRCGFPEVVYCEGKTVEAIAEIFTLLRAKRQDLLGTRVSEDHAQVLTQRFPELIHNSVARTVRFNFVDETRDCGRVVVITAGTTDRPVAEEALETLRWMRVPADLITDVGVAGPHRLPERMSEFIDAAALVVVAGMEGALPSVVGGYASCPVIGVPTSVGYGANFAGMSALLSMLNSCAANVTVVNIDAGFKGGYVAGMIASGQVKNDRG